VQSRRLLLAIRKTYSCWHNNVLGKYVAYGLLLRNSFLSVRDVFLSYWLNIRQRKYFSCSLILTFLSYIEEKEVVNNFWIRIRHYFCGWISNKRTADRVHWLKWSEDTSRRHTYIYISVVPFFFLLVFYVCTGEEIIFFLLHR
jgi:hypothetical protein